MRQSLRVRDYGHAPFAVVYSNIFLNSLTCENQSGTRYLFVKSRIKSYSCLILLIMIQSIKEGGPVVVAHSHKSSIRREVHRADF